MKITFPLLLTSLCAVLVYVFFQQLPQTVQQTLSLLPFILFAAVILMAIYFNLGHLFYLSLTCFLVWVLHDGSYIPDSLTINLTFITAVLMVMLMALIKEKGLFTLAAWLSHFSIILLAGFAYGLWIRQPTNMISWLALNLLPETWFFWSSVSQISWFVLIIAWLILLLLLLKFRDNTQAFKGLVALLVITFCYQWSNNQLALLLVCCTGLMVLLFTALQQSWHLAYVDELTALPGRRALEERLQRSLGIYALAMVDVDHFKKFNDSYGHDVGDDVLRMIAAKIGQVKGGGKAFRYGGEEFTIVFSNHSADEVKTYLQAVIDDIAATPFVVNRRKNQKPKKVKVTVSIGLTDSINKANVTETIKIADNALYQAKKKGRNRMQIKA